MTTKPHLHAEVIRAWADGAQIEYRKPSRMEWIATSHPAFVEDYEYRVKPARVYPETLMTDDEISSAWGPKYGWEGMRIFGNATLRHALDNGQVVTREEFKRVSDEANKAVRSLNAFGFTDHGGELWKPPLGNCFVITASNG